MTLEPTDSESKSTIEPRHLDELRASGLTDETILTSGIRSVRDGEVATVLGWKPKDFSWGTGWCVPYPCRNGEVPYSRVKLDFPRHAKDAKPIKYESPVKVPNRAYFPPGFDALCRTTDTIIVTEGEKKALAVQQLGIPCVGLPGVWAWQRKRQRSDTGRAFGKRELIADLQSIDWRSKILIVVFDSDVAGKSEVQTAEVRLAEALTERGAIVKVARLPQDGDGKVGADDYIVKHGADAFRHILDEAKAAELPKALAPMDWAKLFVEEFFTSAKGCELFWWRDQFWRWTGTHYTALSDSELTAIVLTWLDQRRKMTKPRHAADVVRCLGATCRIDFQVEPPTFLKNDGNLEPANVIPFRNGLLDITNIGGDLRLLEHSPHWFCSTCLAYDFQPEADCPQWLAFLREVLVDDDSILLLQKWFGLCLTHDTLYQKLLFMIGPKRSGKGTTLRILQHILGSDACVSPTLSSLATEFGLWQLVGKSLAAFADAHLGRSVDSTRVLEIIKSVVGEDSVSINRKNLPFLPNVRLPIRFIVSVNELPRFNDSTLALEARLLPLIYPKSFAGREDRTLESRLKPEAAGILNWALGGLFILRRDGGFTLPGRSVSILEGYRRLCSPVLGFVEDGCEVSPTGEVATDILYEQWKTWCQANGHEPGSAATFGEHLRAAVPEITKVRKGSQQRWNAYRGIGLRHSTS